MVVTIHSARPGIVIGRGGQRVEEVRQVVEGLTHKRARLNVQEVRQPELDAQLVAASIAEQLGRRVAFRRAMHQAVNRAMQAGALGMKVICSGRLGGVEIARREKVMQGPRAAAYAAGGHRLRSWPRLGPQWAESGVEGLGLQGRHPAGAQGGRGRGRMRRSYR